MLALSSDLIQYVRTPLALAALVIILGAPIVGAIMRRKGRPNADTKAVIRYGFGLGLVLGVLAIASSMYTSSFAREIRISGIVRTVAGDPIPYATVRIPGREGGITQEDGSFAFTVPDSRAAEVYEAEVHQQGYLVEHVKLEGRYPSPVSVVLKPIEVNAETVFGFPPEITLRHNLGIPQVEVSMRLRNPFPREITLTDIHADLTSPSGTLIPLWMEGISVVSGTYGPPIPIWKLDKGESTTITYSFFNATARFAELQKKVYDESLPQLNRIVAPDVNAKVLSDSLTSELREFMKSQFIWTPGSWSLRFTCDAGEQIIRSSVKFDLREADVRKMEGIAALYQSGIGVFPNWRFWSSQEIDPAATIAVSRQ